MMNEFDKICYIIKEIAAKLIYGVKQEQIKINLCRLKIYYWLPSNSIH